MYVCYVYVFKTFVSNWNKYLHSLNGNVSKYLNNNYANFLVTTKFMDPSLKSTLIGVSYKSSHVPIFHYSFSIAPHSVVAL